MASLPIGVRFCCRRRQFFVKRWQLHIFLFTLIIYATFHASRKPISVVKSVLHPNCTEIALRENKTITPEDATFCMWKPFHTDNYNALFGYIDLAYLLSYAVGMFISGHIAERVNLRTFLLWGCILSGVTTAAFGLGYFADIHDLAFYLLAQVVIWLIFTLRIVAGLTQSSAWPAVVTCMGNWFGKGSRGLILGVWNSHISLGNILGGVLAGIFVEFAWGWSFFVPGLLLVFMGFMVCFFLVPYPEDLGFQAPHRTIKRGEEDTDDTTPPLLSMEQNDVEGHEALLQSTSSPISRENVQAISFCGALAVPGVVEYSLALFFIKATAYIFLFWLPRYLKEVHGLEASLAADTSAVFDAGGILGGIVAGLITDRTTCYATVSVIMLALGMPSLYLYFRVGDFPMPVRICMLLTLGFLIVGPYSLITTVVSADLGTHQSLAGNAKALSTVVAIIDGTGSIGAAIGPFVVGLLVEYGWGVVFIMLIAFLGIAILLLFRRVVREIRGCCRSSVHYVSLS
ncbi:solute carrier family [Echinococcus multilocularis]|uniref:Sugar phosphate exchanger 3 n=1 Tax=Echinococcus multilocularis TaxID=6211 RepID=A0A068XVT4_ECHMU|nr:solute carrier family [Echinococcus multilocularis]